MLQITAKFPSIILDLNFLWAHRLIKYLVYSQRRVQYQCVVVHHKIMRQEIIFLWTIAPLYLMPHVRGVSFHDDEIRELKAAVQYYQIPFDWRVIADFDKSLQFFGAIMECVVWIIAIIDID